MTHCILGLPGIEKFGLAMATDGATIQRHPMMNVMGLSVVFSNVMLLAVLDATEHLARGFHKDAEYIANSIIPIIRQLPNPLCLDLIVCDGAADMTRFRLLLCALFPFVLSIWCISHITNRIFSKIGDIYVVGELIRKGKLIVDKFGSSKHFEHALFESKCMEILHKRRALLHYCETRFGLYFIMLHRILQLKSVLLACVTCPEYLGRYPEGDEDEVKAIIMDPDFWSDVTQLISVVWPLIQLIRLGDANKPSLFAVYRATKLVKKRFMALEGKNIEYIGEVISAFEQYEPELLSEAAKVHKLSLFMMHP
jgi:hypothetical protein